MNPTIKNIFKIELKNILDVGSIYQVSNSQWVSLLVVVPKKNGKCKICVDYRELNKSTRKDHFPLPFVDQVLDTLSRKKCFSFLVVLVDISKCKFILMTKIRQHLRVHGAHFPTWFFLLACAMPQLIYRWKY